MDFPGDGTADQDPRELQVVRDYRRVHGIWPRFNPPITFNEKICWRKLYDHDPRFPDLVDKIKAKEIIATKYGADLIISTLAVYDRPEDMEFAAAPLNQPPYVLKANHGYAMNVFVKDPAVDPVAIRAKLKKFLAHDHGARFDEWAYSQVKRRILCEPFIETPDGDLTDYKLHVFSGRVYAIDVHFDRYTRHTRNLYTVDWQLLPFTYVHPNHPGKADPPSCLRQMIEFAEDIGSEFAYVRVDLYEVDQKIKFGELTFYPGAGLESFKPPVWDYTFGAQWHQDWTKRR